MPGGRGQQPEPALDRPQQAVAAFQQRESPGVDHPAVAERHERRQRAGGPQARLAAAVHELEHLRRELDVHHAPGPTLEVRRLRPLLHP